MKTNKQLINNIIGQLKGIDMMMDGGTDCSLVLNQIKAAKSAFKSLTNKFLQENFIKCLDKEPSKKEDVCDKFFKEISKNN